VFTTCLTLRKLPYLVSHQSHASVQCPPLPLPRPFNQPHPSPHPLMQALSDPEQIRREMQVGIRSLEQLQAYAGMDSGSGREWEVNLKGSCS
jgi:hypothetical protein